MCVTRLLEQIERLNRDDSEAAAEFGPLMLGPRGVEIDELVCVDGRTTVTSSPQIREFYAYATWWRHCSVRLEWRDPHTTREWNGHGPVREMIVSDTAPGFLTPAGLTPSSTVLFALDDQDAPFERAYFTFDGRAEPQVVYAGSEVSVFDDLTGYLESWRQTLG
ncbi:hypothetical protein SAMN06297387_10842 [Streptomyces zhaozhouensis]|uniref:SUKH-3 immunity protein n=1 Tax=Streptomyces zhaozhouensis TaxID=1300267 RepID=A0A286DW27_9ACTN|nr:hypothetical protein [Streptomyces zhaozhouensis]SOD62879.1 hypothetical protein SAMN06297387_10842 [Streptomyces zhaozhouensis]